MPSRLLACLMLLGWAVPARAHVGDAEGAHLSLSYKITIDEVLLGAGVPDALLAQMLGRPIDLRRPQPADALDHLATSLVAAFAAGVSVTIDGVRVPPALESATFVLDVPPDTLPAPREAPTPAKVRAQAGPWPMAQLILRYPASAGVSRVELGWHIEAAYSHGPEKPVRTEKRIEASLYAGGDRQTIAFTPEAPTYVWAGEGTPVTRSPAWRLEPPRPPTWPLPIASLAAALIAIGAWLGLRRASAAPKLRAAALVVGVIGAAATWNDRPIDVRLPLPWLDASAPPEAEALAVFDALHRNLYRAFEYSDESAIYDTLAQSTDGPQLDWMYDHVYRSLVIREAGGAVATVRAITPQERRFEPREDGGFRVWARWHLEGEVEHWGHVHRRTHEYEASYTLARREVGWRIVHTEVLGQKRISTFDGGEDP